jgi:hypothetical protein
MAAPKKHHNCRIEGCTFTNRMSLGYCSMHYQRFKRFGDPNIKLNPAKSLKTKKLCKFSDCSNIHRAKGYCAKHYNRLLMSKKNSFKKLKKISQEKILCSAYECENYSLALGYCSKHYQRFKRNGDININYTKKYQNKKSLTLSSPVIGIPNNIRYTMDEKELIDELTKTK